ncbi:mono-ADP-ribosyltransferase PARP12-like 3 [Homarus americanus]|uniref:Poly [ADP-ribose] polymerase n=1 Tax=Homarus americanus TaxID=6706 RepID=A0A8J5MWF6_HOMAM|nr:mono-ADP-ribosyltransferase PARP12-like 3 [Homarus americanus]
MMSGEDDQKNEMGSEDGLDEWVKVLQNIQVQEEETRNKLQPDNWRQRSDEPLRYNWKQLFERNSNKQYEPLEPLSPVHVTPRLLVDSLVGYPKFSASLDELMMEKNMIPSDVQEVVSSQTKVFYLLGNTVQLSPQVSICKDHSGAQGCQKLLSCSDLHICPNFVTRSCQDENCSYGHTWLLDHNRSILHQLCIDWLPSRIIFKLIQQRRETIKVTGPLQVCFKYNGGGCDQTDCAELHVCFTFLTGLGKCSRHDCQLNHNFLTPDCCRLLRIHGLPVNETPRDIVLALLFANPTLLQEQNTSPQQIKKKRVNKTLKSNEITMKSLLRKVEKTTFDSVGEEKDTLGVITEDGTGSSESSNTLSGNSNLADVGYTVHVNNGRLTLWSYYLLGNVEIPEICYHSVEDMCKNEGSGCQRLHATQHFHWQVCEADRWINLRPSQVICLERAFCDPSQDGVDLPRLEPATLDHSFRGLLILLGHGTWHADFKTMMLTDSSKTKALPTRRLCTETVPGQVIKPATFIWYFFDLSKNWISYGHSDTLGSKDLVSNITSEDIEKHFLQNPSQPLIFKNLRFSYILDFNTMQQTNQRTKTSRLVVRRPMVHLQDEVKVDQNNPLNLPLHWEKMNPGECVRVLALKGSSSEYEQVVGLLKSQIPTSKIVGVQRIQNPFLWRAFDNKVGEMTALYGNASKVGVCQLFHGTQHEVVPSIWTENFDWRLHGSRIGNKFGQGTYFSTNPVYSYQYCTANSSGMKSLMVALTAVGYVTLGNSTMVRPPKNPATGLLFDSTVDKVSKPSIIVKYDKQEYYPQYIILLI